MLLFCKVDCTYNDLISSFVQTSLLMCFCVRQKMFDLNDYSSYVYSHVLMSSQKMLYLQVIINNNNRNI